MLYFPMFPSIINAETLIWTMKLNYKYGNRTEVRQTMDKFAVYPNLT